MESHREGLKNMIKTELLDVVRLYNAEKRLPITFRMSKDKILEYLMSDKSIDHTLLEKAYKQISKVGAKKVSIKVDGVKKAVPAKVKKAQPKKSSAISYTADVPVKGRGRGRPSGTTNRFTPAFSNQATNLKVVQ
jgi:hypothetical protein